MSGQKEFAKLSTSIWICHYQLRAKHHFLEHRFDIYAALQAHISVQKKGKRKRGQAFAIYDELLVLTTVPCTPAEG